MILAVKLVCISVIGYFIGNINFAIIISRFLKSDVREQGSGNPGTMNMLRSYGKIPGLLCLIFDMLKTFVPSLFAWAIVAEGFFDYTNLLGAYVCGFAVTFGHVYPVVLKFKGGKGVACIIGLSLLLTPVETVIGFIICLAIILIFHIGFLGSFAAIIIPGIAQAVWININFAVEQYVIAVDILLFLTIFLCVFEHRGNIARLFAGKENKVYLLGKKKE